MVLGTWATHSIGQATDPETGLIIDEGFKSVKAACVVCHSANNIIRQGGLPRLTWLSLIDWMQDTQGMAPLDAATETEILDYLETHYRSQTTDDRRLPIESALLPPNPYTTQAAIALMHPQAQYQAGDK